MRKILFFILATIHLLAGDPLCLHDEVEAQKYFHHSHLQWQWALDSIAAFPFSVNERILDIGCGDGKVTAVLAKGLPNAQIIGVDISPGMLSFASSHFPPESHPNLQFSFGDVQQLPFSQSFDLMLISEGNVYTVIP